MSTPTFNSVPTTTFIRAPGNDGAVQYDVKWGAAYGSGVVLTYSFPDDKAWFVDGYGDDEWDSWYQLNGTEKGAVRSALAEWTSVAAVGFVEVADGKNLVGDLRFALTDSPYDESAHAYLPSNDPEGGDVWFKNGEWHTRAGSKIKKGSYDYLTVLHEIGHAIGLKHPFEAPQKIQKAYDNYAYSIMSYTAAPWGDDDNYASFYPTTPMYYDLVAIQGIYGRGVHMSGDTVYRFKDGRNYWQTIDDSGGTDTIVHVGRQNAVIDLNVGGWSDLGNSIKFSSGATKWTVAIGPGTDIENAVGGTGRDKLIGNGLGNTLSGGRGKDSLVGGGGTDAFVFNTKLSKANVDTIVDFVTGQDVIRLAKGIFEALSLGAVSAEAFDLHFDYSGGVLAYEGKAVARLKGAPTFDEGDLLVV